MNKSARLKEGWKKVDNTVRSRLETAGLVDPKLDVVTSCVQGTPKILQLVWI